jgi:hypothetical protein
MIFLDVFIILTLFFLTIPAVCGYYAHSRGRSFWFWFVVGTFLPVIAHLILLFLPKITNEEDDFEKELAELRLQLGIAGTLSEKNENAKINKLLKLEKQKVRFEIKELNQKKIVEIFVNGINLKYLVRNIEDSESNHYEGIPLHLFSPTSLHLLGEPDQDYSDNEKRSALLLCKSDTYFRSALMAKIQIERKYIIWHSFQRNQKPDNQYETLRFVFNKIQYMNSLDEVQQQITVG